MSLNVETVVTAAAAVTTAAGWAATAYRLRHRTRQLDHARRDPVTGLRTRASFEPAASEALNSADVVGLLDLDGFKPINDAHGHPAGDQVLRAVAGRLHAQLGEAAVTGRLGGDELAFVTNLDPEAFRHQLDELVEVLTAPIPVDGVGEVCVGVSLGVTFLDLLPSRAPVLPEALAAADLAMYEAKVSGAGWRLYDPEVHAVRPVASICPAPRWRVREHGPAALAQQGVDHR
ncbi:GGDEF domain-containing protein [Saccharopolyspora taberi]|uniref:GGDEF domain-containing protein n=1 Tax=Saccharopolyspora taberi TaxID=60895 RepID=A0ABN3VF01_9PSEU